MKQERDLSRSKNSLKKLFFATACMLCMLTKADAQPGMYWSASFPESFVGSSTSYVNTVNCDMLKAVITPGNGNLIAIAWGNMVPWAPVTTQEVHVFVKYDATGNTASMTLPSGSWNPDVALADDPRTPGNYFVCIVYNMGVDEVWFDTYPITNVAGAITIGAVPYQHAQLAAASPTPGNMRRLVPHIDMFPDPNTLIGGFPSMHRYAIVYEEFDLNPPYPGGTNTIEMVNDDVLNTVNTSSHFTVMPGNPYNTNSLVYSPDVAASTNTNGTEIAVITWVQGTSYIPVATVRPATKKISVQNVGGPYPDATYPRIEAMGINTGIPNWTAAVSRHTAASPQKQVELFTNTTGPVTSNVISLAKNPGSVFDNYLPVVAAGIGNAGGFANYQHTLGWIIDANGTFGWPYLSQAIATGTGAVVSPYDLFINSASNPVIGIYPYYNGTWHIYPTGYPYGVNPGTSSSILAMSSNSNAGDFLLSAWFNGLDILYKTSGAYAFKTTDVASASKADDYSVYPNPATNTLTVTGVDDAAYTITNTIGQTVGSGKINKANATLNIANLTPGVYTLGIMQNEKTHSSRFVKQ